MAAPAEGNLEAHVRRLADGRRHTYAALGCSDREADALAPYLADLGIDHEADATGLRILSPLDLLSDDRILGLVSASGRRLVERLETHWRVDSTNTRLMSRFAEQDCHGLVMMAEQQTSGRGRRGKEWISPFGRNIYVSFGWSLDRSRHSISGLSLAVGVEVARALLATGIPDVKLKWPNDLLVGGRKLGGILIELCTPRQQLMDLVVGIGINLDMPEAAGAEIDQRWIDVKRALGRAVNRSEVAARVIENVVEMLAGYPERGFAHHRTTWEELDEYANKSIELHLVDRVIRGVGAGVSETGALRLRTETGVEYYEAGEISLRGTP